jgi:hypothetical protein
MRGNLQQIQGNERDGAATLCSTKDAEQNISLI